MVKKFSLIFVFMLMALTSLTACSTTNSAAVTLVPAKANTVIQIQVGKILSDPTLNLTYGQLAASHPDWPQTSSDAMDRLNQNTGFDLSSVSSVVLFSNVQSMNDTQNHYAGLIASGTFNESTIITNIRQKTHMPFPTSTYKGFTIYSGEQDQFEIAFISSGRLIAGTPAVVRDIIDVDKGDQQSLGGTIIEALNRVGSALITGAVTPSADISSQLDEVTPQIPAVSLKAFKDIDAIGFAINQESLSVSARIEGHFVNTSSMQDARNAITGLISLAEGTSQDQNVKTALGNIQVNTSGSWLSTRYTGSVGDIGTIINSFQQQGQQPSP